MMKSLTFFWIPFWIILHNIFFGDVFYMAIHLCLYFIGFSVGYFVEIKKKL